MLVFTCLAVQEDAMRARSRMDGKGFLEGNQASETRCRS